MSDSILSKKQQYAYNFRNTPSDGIEITFQVTAQCNMRCTYCYEEKQSKRMNINNAYKLIDRFFPISDNLEWWNGYLIGNKKNDFTFNFFGGECFLEVNMMEKICSYFIKKCDEDLSLYQERKDKFKIICQSNGTLLRTKKVKKFLKKWKDNLILFVTIDGCKELHDQCRLFKDTKQPTWEIVHQNILWYKHKYHKLPETKGTFTPETIKYLYKSYLAYKSLGYKDIIITPAVGNFDWNSCIEEAKTQYKLIVKNLLKKENKNIRFHGFKNISDEDFSLSSCGINGTGVCLSYTNELFNCIQFTQVSIPDSLGKKHFIIGTIDKGITETKNIETVKYYIDKYFDENDGCHSCQLSSVCPSCYFNEYRSNTKEERHLSCQIEKIEGNYSLLYHYLMEKKYGKNY